jgi:aryl-alcohol dehydrogenase-like predicted oxidoreductase
VNFIDTADVYSFGGSETLVGQSLKNLGVPRKDVVIATKVFGEMGPGPNDRSASRGHIMDSIHGSLDRLQTDHIDLYQIHGDDPITPIEETLRAMDDLTRQGLVRYFGVSNWAAWKIAKALGLSEARGYGRFETVQAYYSIAGRDLERELVPMMVSERVGLMVWSPLAGGLLSGKYGPGRDDAAGLAPHRLRFPAGGHRARLGLRGRDAQDRRGSRGLRRPDRPGLGARQAVRDHGDHRRQERRTARRQPRRRGAVAHRRGDRPARQGERTAAGIPRLDGLAPRRRPDSEAVHARESLTPKERR